MNDKTQFITMLREEFNRWEELLTGISEAQIIAPDFISDSSIKDTVAHLTARQKVSVARMQAARRQSVGEQLMKRAEGFASETNSRGLFLHTATDNFPAQRLYERCGWVRDEKFYRYDRIFR